MLDSTVVGTALMREHLVDVQRTAPLVRADRALLEEIELYAPRRKLRSVPRRIEQ